MKQGGAGAPGADFSQFESFNFAGFDPHHTFRSFFGDEDPFKGKLVYIIHFISIWVVSYMKFKLAHQYKGNQKKLQLFLVYLHLLHFRYVLNIKKEFIISV